MSSGHLYLIPSALDENFPHTLLPEYLVQLKELRLFVVENIRSARRFIKKVLPDFDINTSSFWELDKHNPTQNLKEPLDLMLAGHSIGLLSEAGCPGVADPGNILVELAHNHQIRVIPWIGPSSILLALMASGLNGQRFMFHGYLPQDKSALAVKIRQIEADSLRSKSTQLFIETPYRNQSVYEACLQSLKDSTRLCVAINLTGPEESVMQHRITNWRKMDPPDLHKKPAIFLIEA